MAVEAWQPARNPANAAGQSGANGNWANRFPSTADAPHAYPVSLDLSLRAQRGNLVRATDAATGTRSPRRCAPRDDKLDTREQMPLMRTSFGRTGEFAWMPKMERIELMRCAISVQARSEQQRRPNSGKAAGWGTFIYDYSRVSKSQSVPVIQLIPSRSSC